MMYPPKRQINARHRIINQMHPIRANSLPRIYFNQGVLKKTPQRLQFPRKDDSLLYHGFGRKHFLGHNETSAQKFSQQEIQNKIQKFTKKNHRLNSEGIKSNDYLNSPVKYDEAQPIDSESIQIPKMKIQTKVSQDRQYSQPSSPQNIRTHHRMQTELRRDNQYQEKIDKIEKAVNQKVNFKTDRNHLESKKQMEITFSKGKGGIQQRAQRLLEPQNTKRKLKYLNPTFLSTQFFS